MSWITVIWSMAAAACLTLAAVHLPVWWRNRQVWSSLMLSSAAIGVAGVAACELWMMWSDGPAEYGFALRLLHVPTWIVVASMVGFVRVHLQAGRPWLAWTVVGLRSLSLLLNFLVGANLNYSVITGLRRIPFLGETVSIPVGMANAWMLVGQASLVLFWIFVADATLTVWRRGERREALVVGGSMVFFTMASVFQSILVFWGLLPWPLTASLGFLPVVAVMGLELSREVFRAAQLGRDLHESQQQMNLAAAAVDLGFWVRHSDRDDIWASASWRNLFGFSPDEPLDLARFLQRVHPDDRERVRATLRRAQAGDGHYGIQFRLVLPDGRTRWIASHGRVEFDRDGRPQLVRGVSLDITLSKQAELEAQRQREELVHFSRVAVLGELSGSLAHELNQPLGAILRNAEAAEIYLQSPTPDLAELRAIVADIRQDDQRAGAVISRMRAMLKRRPVEYQAVDMPRLATEVIRFVQANADARKVAISLESSPGLPAVRGDPVQLQQVLLNLLLNAMDAVDGLPPDRRRVAVRLRQEGRQVEVAVSDTGPGLPAEKPLRIFEPFFTTKTDGLGMGLPISRSIVEAHGGKISAENAPAGGAVFSFTLPVAERKAEP